MENLPERFPHCDARLYPHLEKVLTRLPQNVRADILDRGEIQFVADEQFRDACMLHKEFTGPVQKVVFLNTKMLGGPEHLVLLAIASGIAYSVAGQKEEDARNREAEVLLRKWGFTEELLAVRFDQQIAGTEGYRAGYDWARGQNVDYLMKHFGLYLESWTAGSWGKPSEQQAEAIDLPEETLSKLQEMVGMRRPEAVETPAEAGVVDIDPRQAILAGIMTALQELQWLQQGVSPVCRVREL